MVVMDKWSLWTAGIKFKFCYRLQIETSFITNDGRAHDGCDALEEKQQAKGVGQLVKAEEVDEDDGGQADVSSGRDSKDGAENGLKVE